MAQERTEHEQETVAGQPDETRPGIEDGVLYGTRLEGRVWTVLEDRRAHQQPDEAGSDRHYHEPAAAAYDRLGPSPGRPLSGQPGDQQHR